MTQVEFENRAMQVTAQEFNAINEVYMNSDLDKDEFCKMWCKMNAKRVSAYKAAKKAEAKKDEQEEILAEILYTRYNDKEYSEIAENILNKREIEAVKFAGIDMEEKTWLPYADENGTINYILRFRYLYEIVADIRRYFRAA